MKQEYISSKQMKKEARKAKTRIIAGEILSGFFLLSVVMALTDPELKDGMSVYVGCLLLSLFLLYRGVRRRRFVHAANRYNSIFQCDYDGCVTMEELVKQTGKKDAAIISEIEILLNKGLLCNCTLIKEGKPRVILSDIEVTNDSFAVVRCEFCGGSNRVRIGTTITCEYCGGHIKAIEKK